MPEQTLLDFADHGHVGDLLPTDGGNSAATLLGFERARVDVRALAVQLQEEGADAFVQSWDRLISSIDARGTDLLVSA